MEHDIQINNTCVQFTLIRKKMRNIRIRVTGASKVVVSAPYHSSENSIHQAILANGAFILQEINEFNHKRNLYYPKRYLSGDHFWYLGEKTPLIVTVSGQTSASHEDNMLVLHVPKNADYRYRKALFILWMERQAKGVFAERLEAISKKFPTLALQNVRLTVKNMLTRWGSINTQRQSIHLTVHLLRCEPELIDYVIIHELCHFRHNNHSKAFYEVLSEYCPNRKQLDKKLRDYSLIDF